MAALEDQEVTPPPCAALAPVRLAFRSHPHDSPSLFTTTTPQALRGLTDQQVCGPPVPRPFPLTPTQTAQLMESR